MAAISPDLPTNRIFVTRLLDSLSSLPIDQSPAAAGGNVDPNVNANPLNNLPDATRKQLLSLQVLFPNEFVPALDLLDRRLVTRFRICDEEELAAAMQKEEEEKKKKKKGGKDEDIHMQSTESEALPQQEGTQREDENTAKTCTNPTTTKEAKSTTPKDKVNDFKNNTIYYVRSAQHRPSRFATSYDTTTSYQVRLSSWNCSCPAFAFSAFPATRDGEETDICLPNPTQPEANNSKWVFGGITLGDGMPPVCKHLLACVLVEKLPNLFGGGGFLEERNVSVEEAAGWAAGWGD